ncbi:hypothetical protein DEU56DRAFT_752226 [Suillus clintonianus]|uniref:uncharacterized protein n=1 Tax=Suillus clintonianus TaxID=1904413 RepID=UPI001B87BEC0|nr:uncharacterized protein DEU56DRAFT_752226 [Suillus clintonianus]KAG2152971.1 hypothetical protein DEU56DRAFT_752226 [Suillus clintonianus]
MQGMSIPSAEQLNDSGRCICVCKKHGDPHVISIATWYRHLHDAGTQEEKEHIRTGRLLRGGSLQPPSQIPGSATSSASGSATHNGSEPPNIHGNVAMDEQDDDAAWRIGRRKRARIAKIDPVDHVEQDEIPMITITFRMIKTIFSIGFNILHLPDTHRLPLLPDTHRLPLLPDARRLPLLPDARCLLHLPDARHLLLLSDARRLPLLPDARRLLHLPDARRLLHLPDAHHLLLLPDARHLLLLPDAHHLPL